jgi:hypothetical protein
LILVLIVCASVSALVLIKKAPEEELTKWDLPGWVSVTTPRGLDPIENLGSEKDGWSVLFLGENYSCRLSYIPLEKAKTTYGSDNLDQITQSYLNIIELAYGAYDLIENKMTEVDGHAANIMKIQFASDKENFMSVHALWICPYTNRFFIFLISAPKSIFQSKSDIFETILTSILCH